MSAYFQPLSLLASSKHLPEPIEKLHQLAQKGLPINQVLVVTPAALRKIAHHNHLSLKLLAVPGASSSPTQFKRAIQTLETHIRKQAIPPSLATSFFSLYHSHLKGAGVIIKLWSTDPAFEYQAEAMVIGDAASAQGLLDLWAEATRARLSRHNTASLGSVLFNFYVTIQPSATTKMLGTSFTSHHQRHNPRQITIKIAKSDLKQSSENSSYFTIDARTGAIIDRPVDASPISEAAIENIVANTLKIKRHFFGEHACSFILDEQDNCLFTEVESFMPPEHQQAIASSPKRSRLLLQSTNQPTKREPAHSLSDGTLLKSEYLFAQFGMYPPLALKSAQKRAVLQKKLHKFLNKGATQNGRKKLLYRAYDFTSNQLANFTHPGNVQVETNPLLGHHGSLHLLYQPKILKFQYEVVRQVAENNQISFVIPATRSILEIQKITRFLHQTEVPLWFEVVSPWLILQPKKIAQNKPAGVILELDTLLKYLYGYSSEILEKLSLFTYDLDQVATQIVAWVTKLERADIKVLVQGSAKLHPLLIEVAKQSSCGLITSTTSLEQLHQQIIDLETKRVGVNHG